MPVSVVVGGQYGSEGKGKVAYSLAEELGATAAVRVGGTNSGHTVVTHRHGRVVLRQLPTAALLNHTTSVLPAGSFISEEILLAEIGALGLSHAAHLAIDPWAVLVEARHENEEREIDLAGSVGSTGVGVGSALWHKTRRDSSVSFAKDSKRLSRWLQETKPLLRSWVAAGKRVVIEGTQGFGLSLIHGSHYPFATSRDTTAASALSEAGLSPLDVDQVVLVIRTFPIRVAGNSGPLAFETSWDAVRDSGGHDHDLTELTSVTRRVRRVAEFDANVVRRAIDANNPSSIILNHVDLVDHHCCLAGKLSQKAEAFIASVEALIGRPVDRYGLGPAHLERREASWLKLMGRTG